MRAVAAVLVLTVAARAERRIRLHEFSAPTPAPPGSLIAIGFLGAWEVWDNPKRSGRKLALRLRDRHLPGLYLETAGNHSRSTVRKFLLRALDQNRNGRIDQHERTQLGIVLYGQSMGGSAAVLLARELARWNVPVLLTVQIDSVGRHDDVIPPNVARAMNLYQHDLGSIWGRAEIRAADPARTAILGNQRFAYARMSPLSHLKMDNDPEVWAIVERLILAEVERWRASNGLAPSARAETSKP
jgi:hypothetical protein